MLLVILVIVYKYDVAARVHSMALHDEGLGELANKIHQRTFHKRQRRKRRKTTGEVTNTQSSIQESTHASNLSSDPRLPQPDVASIDFESLRRSHASARQSHDKRHSAGLPPITSDRSKVPLRIPLYATLAARRFQAGRYDKRISEEKQRIRKTNERR